ncbi:MAG: glycosyltransferase family 9 protein [Candidatus Omnitrophota bacterium]|nr:glycosyltransferase family 9 protein [Candidatus Omnitrophota bacterium]
MTKILFIALSNIGDCILTLPVLDLLIEEYPGAEFSVICGPRAKEVFENNTFVKKIIIYDKKGSMREKINFIAKLRGEKYDSAADLRHTVLPFLIGVKRISRLFSPPKDIRHMRDRHLSKMQNAECRMRNAVRHFFQENKSTNNKEYGEYVLVAPGARSHLKRWNSESFAKVCDKISEALGLNVVLVGGNDDKAITDEIISRMHRTAVNLAGFTSISDLAFLVKGAKLIVTCDSACLHLASYLNMSIIAIFGPTDENKYGPWSDNYVVVKREIFCRPCEKAQCKFGTVDCMKLIKPEDVLRQTEKILEQKPETRTSNPEKEFKRILIVRTDRIGDVVLSTPVVKVLRDNFNNAYIAMMVSPATKELVIGNPYLDEVIVYDKDKEHKGALSSFKFARSLRKKKFDLAIILHSTNRVNMIAYLAGIKERIGYSRRLGFLLTKNIPYVKYKGEKHEIEYNLDLLRFLNIKVDNTHLFIPKDEWSEKWADDIFKSYGINDPKEKIIAFHPSASCASRMWPIERFAEVAQGLIKKYNARIIIVSGLHDIALSEKLESLISCPVINLGGKTTLTQLASILRRSTLMISNDSGPVHIAVGCNLPVVVLFGRSQVGLSPARWGPIGASDIVLHKKTGCVVCLAHDCKNDFACLKSIEVGDVLAAVDGIFKLC